MEKIGIDKAVNDFEQVFETLDVKADSMNEALHGVHSSSISNTQVEELMGQLKDTQATGVENSGAGQVSNSAIAAPQAEVKNEDDDLMSRLKNLQE